MSLENYTEFRFRSRSEKTYLDNVLKRGLAASTEAIARYSLDPTEFNFGAETLKNDREIARALANIKVTDPQLVRADLEEGEKLKLMIAKAKSAEGQATDSKVKSKLRKFVDKVSDMAYEAFTRAAGAKSTRLAVNLAFLAAAACSPVVAKQSVPVSNSESKAKVSMVTPGFADKIYQYDGRSSQIIDEVFNKYGIYIDSPKEWLGRPNLAWPGEAFSTLEETLPKLPADYLTTPSAPKVIVLIRTPGTTYKTVGGGADEPTLGSAPSGRVIFLYISEKFDINARLDGLEGEVYGDARTDLKGVIAHEFTHVYMKDHPEKERKFEEETGWFKDSNGNYINIRPDELTIEAYANKKPSEAIAVSVSRMMVSPSKLSPDVRNFFYETEPWASWHPVVAFESAGGK